MQEDRRGDPLGIGWPAGLDEVLVDLLGMGQRALLRAVDVGLDDLLVLGPIQPAGKVVGRLFVAEVHVERGDEVAVLGLRLPEVADRLGQEPQHAAGPLEVGDRRGLAVERGQQLGMEGVRLGDLLAVFTTGRSLGKIDALADHAAVVVGVAAGDLLGRLLVHAGEHAMADDGADLVLGRGRQDVLLASRNALGLSQGRPDLIVLLAEGIPGIGQGVDEDGPLALGGELHQRHEEGHGLLGKRGLGRPERRR